MLMKQLRTGVIGVGTWGVNHARAYSAYPLSHLQAVCDQNKKRAEQVAAETGSQEVYTDYRQMLKEANLDAVSVATPDFLHREIVEASLDAGLAVLVEKPLTTNQSDLDAILDRVESSGGKFAVNYMMRWSPKYAKARQAVEEKHLGEPLLGEARFHDAIQVPREMLSWSGKSSPLFFIGIHIIDALLWVLGRRVVEVESRALRKQLVSEGIDTSDCLLSFLTLDNDAIIVLEAGWCLPESAKAYVEQYLRLVGTKGVIEVDHTNGGVEVYSDPLMSPYAGAVDNVRGYPFPATSMGYINGRMYGYLKEAVCHFVDCVLYDQPHIVTLEECRHTTEVMLAVNESAKRGKKIKLS